MIREGTDGGSRFFAITVDGRPDFELSYRNVVSNRMHEKERVRLPNTATRRASTIKAYQPGGGEHTS